MSTRLTDEVKTGIRALLESMQGSVDTPLKVNGECTCGCNHPDDCFCEILCLTVACDKYGVKWNYQTGDNSFTGGAYGLPHWAIVWVSEDFNVQETLEDIVQQLESLLPENR